MGDDAEAESPRPRFRAGLTKAVIDAIRRLPPVQSGPILETIGDDVRATIESASRTDWLDVEVMLGLDAALHETLGTEGFVGFWESFANSSTRIPVLRPLADGALRLFAGPSNLFKLLPRGYGLIARDLGTIDVTADEDARRIELVLREVPKLSRPLLFAQACRGSFAGMLVMLGKTGAVEVDTSNVDSGTIRFVVTWE